MIFYCSNIIHVIYTVHDLIWGILG